jgi:ligand-binding sensor protein/putative methionine-R-sulfoxide reductase with GAF domain
MYDNQFRENMPALRDLIDIQSWQRIQDSFSQVTGVDIRMVDARGNSITSRSMSQASAYSESRQALYARTKVCEDCLPTFLGGEGVVDRNLSFYCIPGIHHFIVPLSIENAVLGYLIMGPLILVMRKPKDQYVQIAEELSMDLDELWDAILQLKVMSFHGAQAMVELVKDVGEYIIGLAYRKIIPPEREYIAPEPQLSKILDLLLDVAFEISSADIGSVMLLDKHRNELSIHASRGLDDDIIAKTRVKVGSRISGLAAKEGKSYLIDNEIQDNRIKACLDRPTLNSAMVVPLKMEDRVVGVLNLGVLNSSPVRFNKNGLELVNKLVGLATVAIPA